MKKPSALLVALLFAAAGTAFAQAPVTTTGSNANQTALHQKRDAKGKNPKSPAQKADRKASKMAKELGLNPDQEAQVEKLLLARAQENAALKVKYATDKKAGRADTKAAHDRYHAQLKAILTPEQYAKFNQLKAEHHDQDKAKGAGKAKM